jgi:hypothetical protein
MTGRKIVSCKSQARCLHEQQLLVLHRPPDIRPAPVRDMRPRVPQHSRPPDLPEKAVMNLDPVTVAIWIVVGGAVVSITLYLAAALIGLLISIPAVIRAAHRNRKSSN